MDSVKLDAQLAKEGDKPTIIVPVSAVSADKVTVVLTAEIVKAMENKQAIWKSGKRLRPGSYKLPAAQYADGTTSGVAAWRATETVGYDDPCRRHEGDAGEGSTWRTRKVQRRRATGRFHGDRLLQRQNG